MADEDLVVKARIDDELSAPLQDIRRDLNQIGDEATTSSSKATRASRGWSTFGRVAKGALLGVAAASAAAGYATYRLMTSSVAEASNLAESLNAVNVVYGKQAKAVKHLGREAAKAIGLSNVEFNGLAVQFSSFAMAVGGKGKGSVRVLDDLTTRAADFASVMNIEVAEAAELFQSGLAGESEPLRKYGINLSAAAVGAYAVKAGLSESATTMTDAAKVQATYGLLMEKTAVTQGDFANTSDSLANQQRILGARFDNAKAKLGNGLLPIMQTGVQWLNREGIPAFLRFSDWFVEDGIPMFKRFGDRVKGLYTEYLPKVKTALGDVRDVVTPVAEAAKEMVDAFLGMPPWARKLLIGAGVGAVIASKLKVPQLASLGLKVASKAAPLPVWVVNNTGGIPGGPKGAPGAVVPGGKPSGPLVPGGKPGTLAGLTKGASLGLGRLIPFLGVGIGGDMGTSANGEKLTAATEAQTDALLDKAKAAQSVARYTFTAAGALDTARAKAAGFGDELDLVGRKKVDPQVRDTSIRNARDHLARFVSLQIDAGRPVSPYISLNGYERAMQQISTITSAIHSIPNAGVDNGLTYASGGAGGRAREYGGNVKAGQAYVVGERRAELFVPDRSGTILPRVPGGAGGTVTIERDAIRVTVTNPRDNVDVATAVREGIESWLRDREERS